MALVKTGLDIEIKGIKSALQELGLLDRIQDSVALSAQNIVVNIQGLNSNLRSITPQAKNLTTAFNDKALNDYSGALNRTDIELAGFSNTVRDTVPHLQKISQEARDFNSKNLESLKNLQFDTTKLDAASKSIAELREQFNLLSQSLEGGVTADLQRVVGILNSVGSDNALGTQVSQLSLGFKRLSEVKNLDSFAANTNKLLDVLRRLGKIELTGVLTELQNIGSALRSAGDAVSIFSKNIKKDTLTGIDTFIALLRRLSQINIIKIGAELPVLANSLNVLADAFRKFASGEPGKKLPQVLAAVTLAFNQLIKTFQNLTSAGISQLSTDLNKVAPSLKEFAKAFKEFANGKNISNLPQRIADIKEALRSLRDAFKLKNVTDLAPKLNAIAPSIKALAEAFRAFTTGTNIKDLGKNLQLIVQVFKDLSKLPLSTLSASIGTLGPNVKVLAEAFRAFTSGTNIDDLPKRLQAVVDGITKLSNLQLGKLGTNLTSVVAPLKKFFDAFRLFSGSGKFGNIGKQLTELQKGLQSLKKLGLKSFAKEIKEVSGGLDALLRVSNAVNSRNIAKLSSTMAQLRLESQKTTLINRALSTSYNILIAPIFKTVNAFKTLSLAIIKLPINIFITQLKVLRAVFISFPLAVVRKGFELLANAVRIIINIFKSYINLINNLKKQFTVLANAIKAVLFPLTLLIKAMQSFINIASKFASIFTAFNTSKTKKSMDGLNQSVERNTKALETNTKSAVKVQKQYQQVNKVTKEAAANSGRLSNSLSGTNAALAAVNTAQVLLLGRGIATATKRILAFAAAAKSLQVLGSVFQRLNLVVQQFGREVIGGAFAATAEFEQLRLQIQSLLAKEFVKLEKATTVQEALGLEELNDTFLETLGIIKQLAIQSPFETTDVTKVFQMAQSFGFVREQALDITRILTDASAALGLSGDDAKEVAKVFGQIKSLGKLLAGDVNQLAQRGINVKTILKDVGLSMEEVQQGALSADEAIELILGTLKRDFGGAAARATNTLQGLSSTFAALQKDVLRFTFTPLFEGLKPFVGELLGTFQNDAFLEGLTRFGENIRDNVLGTIIALVKPIVALTTAFINLPQPIQNSILAVAKFVGLLVLMSTTVAALQAVITVLGVAFAFIFNPLSAVVALAATFTATIISNRQAIVSWANYLGSTAYSYVQKFGESFSGFGTIFTAFENNIISIGKSIKDFFAVPDDLGKNLSDSIKTLPKIVVPDKKKLNRILVNPKEIDEEVEAVKSAVKTYQGLLDEASGNTGLEKLTGSIRDSIKNTGQAITAEFIPIPQEIDETRSTVEVLTGALNRSIKDVKENVTSTGSTISGTFNVMKDSVVENVGKAGGAVSGFVTETLNTVGELRKVQIFPLLEKFLPDIEYAAQYIADKINFITNQFTSLGLLLQPGITAVSNAFNSLLLVIQTALTQVGTTIENSLNLEGLGTAIQVELTAIGNFFTGFLSETTNFGGGLIESFAGGILTALNLVADALFEMAKLVTFWLEPHSPPNILPNIDKWGEGLMVEYFGGAVTGIEKGFSLIQAPLQTVGRQLLTVFSVIGSFTFATVINSAQLFGGVVLDVFGVLANIGQTVVTQIVLTINLLVQTLTIATDSSLSFKDKFIRILNEVGVYVSGTFVNIASLIINSVLRVINVLNRFANFFIKEFVAVFDSLKIVYPEFDKFEKTISDFTTKSLNTLESFGRNTSKLFSTLLKNVTTFGKGLVDAFAGGILASVNVVAKALSAIGNVVTYWLKPGSPPRLLPDIDDWGTAAADEFLQGFTRADFDKISDFGQVIEELVTTTNPNLDFDFQNINQDFAEAIARGGLSDTDFASAFEIDTEIGQNIRNIAATYFQLSEASSSVVDAQERVAESEAKVAEETAKVRKETEAYDAAINELENQLGSIDDSSTYDAEAKKIQQLQEVIESRYSDEYERTQAQREIEKIKAQQQLRDLKKQRAASQAAVDASEAQLEADQKALENAEAEEERNQELIDLLKERLGLAGKFSGNELADETSAAIGSADELEEKFGDTIGKMKGDLDGLAEEFSLDNVLDAMAENAGDVTSITDGITTAFDRFKEQIQNIKDRVNEFFQTFKDSFGALKEAVQPVTDAIRNLVGEGNVLRAVLISIGTTLAAPIIIGALGSLAATIGTIGGALLSIISLVGPLGLLFGGLAVTVGAVGFGFYLLSQNLIQATGLFGEGNESIQLLTDNVSKLSTNIGNALSDFSVGFGDGLFNSEQNFLDSLFGFDTNNISKSIGNIAAELAQAFVEFNRIIFVSFTGALLGKNPIDTFLSELTGKDYSGTFSTFITNLSNGLLQAVKDAITIFRTNITNLGVTNGVIKSIGDIVGNIVNSLSNVLSGIANFDLTAIEFNVGGVTLTGGPELGNKLAEILGESFEFLRNIDFSTPATLIQTVFEEAFAVIQPYVKEKFVEFINFIFGDNAPVVLETLGTIIDNISSVFTTLFDNIANLGIGQGILQTIFGDNSQSIIDGFNIGLGILSKVLAEVDTIFTGFADNLQSSGLLDSLANLGNQLLYFGEELLKSFGPVVAGLAGAALLTLIELFKELPNILTTVIDTIANVVERLGNFFQAINDAVAGNITFSEMLTQMKDAILGIFTDIFGGLDSLGDNIADVIFGVIETVGRLLGVDTSGWVENWGWVIDIIGDLIASSFIGWLSGATKLFGLLRAGLAKLAPVFSFIGKTLLSVGKKFGEFILKIGKSKTTLDLLAKIFGLIQVTIAKFITFAISSFQNFIIGIAGMVAAVVLFRDGVKEKFENVKNFFSGIFTSIGEFFTNFKESVTSTPAVFEGLFANVTLINPLAFIDEFIPLLKLAIEGIPEIFTGLFEGVEVANPLQLINDALFGEEGFVTNLGNLLTNFETTAESITGLQIINPFEALQITLDLLKTIAPEIGTAISDLGNRIGEITVNDVFEFIAESLDKLITGARDLLTIDLSGFNKIFEPVLSSIENIKTKFEDLRASFIETANLVPGINLGDAELTGVDAAQEKIKTEFGTEPVTVDKKLDLILEDPELSEKAKTILETFKDSYDTNAGAFTTDFASINKDLIEAGFTAQDIIDVASAAGLNVQEGFAEGFNTDTGVIGRESRKLATNTLLELQEALGIKSPSTKARDEVGIFVVEGILAAFENTEGFKAVFDKFSSDLLGLLKPSLSNVITVASEQFLVTGNELFSANGATIAKTFSESMTSVLSTTDFNSVLGLNTIQATTASITQILSKTGQDVVLFKNSIVNNMSTLTTTVTTGFTGFFNRLSESWRIFVDENLALVEDYYDIFLSEHLEPFIADVLEIVTTTFSELLKMITEFLAEVTSKFTTFFTNLIILVNAQITLFINEFRRIGVEIPSIIDSAIVLIKAALSRLVKAFADAGKDAVDGFIDELDKLFERIEESLSVTIEDLIEEFGGTDGRMYANGFSIGQDFINGWISGMMDRLPSLNKVVGDIADSIITTVQNTLDIQSPSRVMYEIGGYTGDGLALGISSKINSVHSSMSSLVNAVIYGGYKEKLANFMQNDVFGIMSSGITEISTAAQARLIELNMNNGAAQTSYNDLLRNNMLNNNTYNNVTTNNSYNMNVTTRPDKTTNVRRQFRTMEFIGV